MPRTAKTKTQKEPKKVIDLLSHRQPRSMRRSNLSFRYSNQYYAIFDHARKLQMGLIKPEPQAKKKGSKKAKAS